MKIENGKIIHATELELYDYWLNQNYYMTISFSQYMEECERCGTRIFEKGNVDACAVTYPDCTHCSYYSNETCSLTKEISKLEWITLLRRVAKLEQN